MVDLLPVKVFKFVWNFAREGWNKLEFIGVPCLVKVSRLFHLSFRLECLVL